MSVDGLPDAEVRDILESVRTIAVVGASQNESRPSNFVAAFLQQRGYRIIPVNPGLAGQTLLGETVYATLGDIPEPVDMIDVFRAPEHVPAIVDEALALDPKPAVIWMQQEVINEPAAKKARAAGLKVVMDRCPKEEIPRLRPNPPK
jgi:predicted CoA-binding protein